MSSDDAHILREIIEAVNPFRLLLVAAPKRTGMLMRGNSTLQSPISTTALPIQ